MKNPYVSTVSLPEFPLWEKLERKRNISIFNFELTARCNLNCRHCYINLPAGDKAAKNKELTLSEVENIADEAASLGALWCMLSGGEPLMREDFFDIYLSFKKKGYLPIVFTNGTLIRQKHVDLFKEYPPRGIEITVYGVTRETYEKVTRKPGSFDAFMQGVNLLLKSGMKVHLKAMALRSNIHEMPEIASFCRERTKEYFHFDPFLHLRFDRDPERNEEIKSERLTQSEILKLEKSDPDRFKALKKACEKISDQKGRKDRINYLLGCGAGLDSFDLGYDGIFRLCSSLWHPDCIYDVKKGSLSDAWNNFVPRVLQMKSEKRAFLETCHVCPLINLCMWCPANAYLETGELDAGVEYFCELAKTRARADKKS